MTWPQSTVDEACQMITDGTHYTPPDVGTGVPFLTVKDFTHDGQANFIGCSHISEEEFAKADKGNSAPKSGDVLFSKDGTVGKVFVVDKDERFAVLSSMAILRPKSALLDAKYFGWVLKTDSCLNQASRSKTGSAIRRIILKDLKRVQFPLPPLAEQKRIAAILDAADALRAKRRESLAQLDTLLQSTFLEMFGDPVTNPKGWDDSTKLGEIAEIVSGITKGRKTNGTVLREVPYLAVANVQNRHLKLDAVKTIAATKAEIEKYALMPGDLLLTEGGDPDKLGRGSLWNGEISECIHQNHVFRVRLKSSVIAPLFLNWIVGSERGKRYFLRSAKQTTGIASINMTQLKGFSILMPPLDLQRRFATIVESIECQKTRLRAHLAELDTLFASLQSRAFNGEL